MTKRIESNEMSDTELHHVVGGAPVAPQHQAYLKSSYQRNGAIWGGLAGGLRGGPSGAVRGAKRGAEWGGRMYERFHGPNSK